jgi:CHAT domain-containing protein
MSSSHARHLRFLALTFATLCLLRGESLSALAQRAEEAQPPATAAAPKPSVEPVTDEEVKEAVRLLNEAVELHLRDRFDEALERERRVLAFYERLYEPNHTAIAQLLDVIGLTAQKKGDLKLAEQMFERALAIYRASPEEHSEDIAGVLLGLGGVWMGRGDFARAEPALNQALTTYGKQLGNKNPKYINALLRVGELYRHNSYYNRAEQLYLEAIARIEEALNGDEEQRRQQCFCCLAYGLASVYKAKGDLARAERIYVHTLQLMKKAFGEDSGEVASLTADFAELQVSKGDYWLAEGMYESSLRMFAKTYGADAPPVARILIRQAHLYDVKGDPVAAEELLRRAEAINRKNFGEQHPDVADVMESLGDLYTERRDFMRAEPMLRGAIEMYRKFYGEDSDTMAHAYNALGYMYEYRGELDRAKALFERALVITEKLFGPNSRNMSPMLSNLALVSLQQGDVASAIDLRRRTDDLREDILGPILGMGSERQKFLYVTTSLGDVFGSISLHAQFAPNNSSAARLAFNAVLRFKARALDAMTDQIGMLRRHASPQDRQLLEALLVVRTQLAALSIDEAGMTGQEQRREKLYTLSIDKERLERDISARSGMFRVQFQPVTLERVQQEIPANAALVEIIVYQPLGKNKAGAATLQFEEPRYAAYVLRRTGEPAFADLGEAAVINRAVAKLREALGNRRSANSRQAARALDEMVMRPVRRLIGDERMLLLSPDGALNLVPFNALLDEHGDYLIENYTIVYLASGRDLLRPRSQRESSQPPLIVADPLFDAGRRPEREENYTQGNRSSDFTQLKYSPLPGTAAEAEAIGELLRVRPLTREEATEKALKQVASPRILHVATHGFFLSDREQGAGTNAGRATLTTARRMAQSQHPLLRSGLVLAGVLNRWSGEGEDGVLTALEAAGLDLWGTQLVVLSACDTGVGEVWNGDGVAGLRRALVLAGSQSQTISLWRISDGATKDLMVSYYKRLLAGEGRAESLRQVQLAMLRGRLKPSSENASRKQKGNRETGEDAANLSTKDYRHPYYWASFIPSGDWRSLAGQER